MAIRVCVVVSFVVLAFLHHAAAQTAHTVGEATGWTNTPPNGAAFYTTWAAGKRFAVGDSLVFNFPTNSHDVQRVRTKQAFDQCNDNDSIGEEISVGPATVNLTTPGDYFFFCTVGSHCVQGQKLAITVAATGGAMPPSSNTPQPPTTTPSTPAGQAIPPPAGSSAHAVAAALSVTLFGVVLSLF